MAEYDAGGASVTGYRAEYFRTDHLGNTRLTFSDFNQDGVISWKLPATGPAAQESEITSENHYYPFGLGQKGPWYASVAPENKYRYNGKEWNDEWGLGLYDFGNRWHDPTLGRFTTVDRFAEKYAFQSAYVMAANDPMKFVDVNGDSIWTTLTQTYNKAGKLTNNFTIHIQGKVLNQMGWFGNAGKVVKGLNDFYNSLSLTQELEGAINNISFSVNFSEASSMKEVDPSDHLIVMVDEVYGKADPALGGGEAGGIADLPGKIGYIEGTNVMTAIHEFGHMMGLGHEPNGTGNIMSYDTNKTHFTATQILDMLANAPSANRGSNRAKAPYSTRNIFYHTSSNTQPWEWNVKKGDIIPRPLVNSLK